METAQRENRQPICEENEALPESVMDCDSVSLKPCHVGPIASRPRQLTQQSNPIIEQLLRDDLVFAVDAEVNKAIIIGDGVKALLRIINTAGVQTCRSPRFPPPGRKYWRWRVCWRT
ncbi:hypothetical protein [Stenotrophomonas sp. CFBP8980]|uniref:hypothetical protein n=1 Tax=Stenotrophomonas sp. CFBP8980 TaxID=3096523 RepID=UPI002A6B707A|nr:hypothetical protein [Stenotrophomonas sp. CFBP8980]MDY1033394.1 hypothetical protein [Stenotrophomonas sp. CFBP8980]